MNSNLSKNKVLVIMYETEMF